MIRKPQVAGQFYPASASALNRELEGLLGQKIKQEEARGLVCPHAGYIYSGKVAALCFAHTKLTNTAVILGPNHTGLGEPFSIMTEGSWQMPLGNVAINASLAKKILAESKNLQEDQEAHIYEHSIEVQLPFLQYLKPEIQIVPIVLSNANFAVYDEIGKAIARAIKDTEKSLIIASSDMTHYEPQEKAKAQDELAMEAIMKIDGRELLNRVKKFNITMCGFGPVAVMLSAAKELGANETKLIKYQTSGDTSGDYSSVVGYAGIMVQ